jgi:hypothetical protein
MGRVTAEPAVLTVAAVLKYGGAYDARYVRALATGVRKHLKTPFVFTVLSDRASDVAKDCGELVDETVFLDHAEWPGWWCKLELCRLGGPVLYFDLDTVVTGDLAALADVVQHRLGPQQILMVADFYRGRPQSGILGWSGDMTSVYATFVRDYAATAHWLSQPLGPGMKVGDLFFQGDGDWLRGHAAADGLDVLLAQRAAPGIASYKVNVQGRHLPIGTSVVCFHGHPRPHEVHPKPQWMLANGWREEG